MEIFHGSDIIIEKPKILAANRLLDFGEGFYTTSSDEQARRWAKKVSVRKKTDTQILLHTEAALAYCKFLKAEQLHG